jgi:uncharacterized protein
MNLNDQRTIPASLAQTWAGLNDPKVLQQCITGCESIDVSGEHQYKVQLALKVGPVSARFTGQLRLEDIVPLVSYKILFEGQGGAAGFGKGHATVALQALDAATSLAYTCEAHVGGKLAQVGSRLIDSVAAKVADDFFKSFEVLMQQQHSADNAPDLQPRLSQDTKNQSQWFGLSPRWGVALTAVMACIALAAWYFYRN